jgi:hypothetical protein
MARGLDTVAFSVWAGRGGMAELTLCVVGFFLALFLFVETLGQINYRITSRFLEVRLFRVCLRRIPLADIKRVSKHRQSFCEPWPNTLRTRKRMLVVTRRSGLFKSLLITPERRYLFRSRLKHAIARAQGEESPGKAPAPEMAADEMDDESED